MVRQLAECVTFRGVMTDVSPASPDIVMLEWVPSNIADHELSSPPRHPSKDSNSCVVVLVSRYSCSLVHDSRRAAGTAPHTSAAVQRQQVVAPGGGEGGGGEGGGEGDAYWRRPSPVSGLLPILLAICRHRGSHRLGLCLATRATVAERSASSGQ